MKPKVKVLWFGPGRFVEYMVHNDEHGSSTATLSGDKTPAEWKPKEYYDYTDCLVIDCTAIDPITVEEVIRFGPMLELGAIPSTNIKILKRYNREAWVRMWKFYDAMLGKVCNGEIFYA